MQPFVNVLKCSNGYPMALYGSIPTDHRTCAGANHAGGCLLGCTTTAPSEEYKQATSKYYCERGPACGCDGAMCKECGDRKLSGGVRGGRPQPQMEQPEGASETTPRGPNAHMHMPHRATRQGPNDNALHKPTGEELAQSEEPSNDAFNNPGHNGAGHYRNNVPGNYTGHYNASGHQPNGPTQHHNVPGNYTGHYNAGHNHGLGHQPNGPTQHHNVPGNYTGHYNASGHNHGLGHQPNGPAQHHNVPGKYTGLYNASVHNHSGHPNGPAQYHNSAPSTRFDHKPVAHSVPEIPVDGAELHSALLTILRNLDVVNRVFPSFYNEGWRAQFLSADLKEEHLKDLGLTLLDIKVWNNHFGITKPVAIGHAEEEGEKLSPKLKEVRAVLEALGMKEKYEVMVEAGWDDVENFPALAANTEWMDGLGFLSGQQHKFQNRCKDIATVRALIPSVSVKTEIGQSPEILLKTLLQMLQKN